MNLLFDFSFIIGLLSSRFLRDINVPLSMTRLLLNSANPPLYFCDSFLEVHNTEKRTTTNSFINFAY